MSDAVATVPTSGHALLLGLAGWVDDDLLACGRELVAVGEDALALELLVASLSAARTVLPGRVRASLVDAVERRLGPEITRTLPSGVPVVAETAHRFAADAGPEPVGLRIAEIALGLPVVARSGARLALTWRVTPAGAAPGPLPHPVLLAVLDDPGPAEVLAYQLGTALARAGVHASVEAFVDDEALPPYQRAAQAAARPLTRPGIPSTPPIGVETPGAVAGIAPGRPPERFLDTRPGRVGTPEPAAPDAPPEPLDTRPAAEGVPASGIHPFGPADGTPGTPPHGALEHPLVAPTDDGPGAEPDGAEIATTEPGLFSTEDGDPMDLDPVPSAPTPDVEDDRLGPDELDPVTAGPDDDGPAEWTADDPPMAWSPPEPAGPDHPSPRPAPRRPGLTAPASDPDRFSEADPGGGPAPRPEDRMPHNGPVPTREQEWARDWRDGSWSTPSGGASAPDPDIEPATSPTPSTPRRDAVPPDGDRTPPEQPLPRRRPPGPSADARPASEDPGTVDDEDALAARHRLDTPNGSPAAGPSPTRATGTSGLDGWLTPNEQELLRRLQDELAARERGPVEPPPRNGTHRPPPGPS